MSDAAGMSDAHDTPPVTHTVLMATGADHPGILDAIAEHLVAQGGHAEEMKVTRLRGLVALVMLVVADEESLERIRGGIGYLAERTGMDITLHDAGDAVDDTRTLRLVTDGPVEARLLKELSNLTRVLNINITDASTETSNPGRQRLDLTLDLPSDLPVEKLHELIGQLLDHHGASWELVSV